MSSNLWFDFLSTTPLLIAAVTLLLRRRRHQSKATRPTVDLPTVHRLLLERYNLSSCKIQDLPSYDDLNFRIVTPTGQQYVFKFNLSNVQGKDLELENVAMQHLRNDAKDPSLSKYIPNVISTSDGNKTKMFTYQASSTRGHVYYVRLLTFMPGNVLANVPYALRTGELLSSVGELLGRCDRIFSKKSFPSEYIKIASERNHFWDLRNALKLQKWTHEVTDAQNRTLLESAFQLFESNVGNLLQNKSILRSQITHNDGNDHNIIVSESESKNQKIWSLVGLIDFGDIVYTNLINNLAIALAYCCCNPKYEQDDRNGLNEYARKTAIAIVSGYHSQMPLKKEELDVVWWCMIGRICHSLASSSHRQKLEPENKYLVISEAPFWQLLKAISIPSFEENGLIARKEFERTCMV